MTMMTARAVRATRAMMKTTPRVAVVMKKMISTTRHGAEEEANRIAA